VPTGPGPEPRCWTQFTSHQFLHEDLSINGCSDSDGESMYSLDGEEIWVADFKQEKGVEPQPPFIDHMSYVEGTYEQAVANVQICRSNLKNSRKGMKDLPVEKDGPSSLVIYSRDDVELGEKNILVCHVSGFYPAPVNVSWTKNGQKVTEGTSINVPFPNKDSTFTQISRLDFIPQLGDIYSCSVDHPALTEPLTRIWGEEPLSNRPDMEVHLLGPDVHVS
uniref:Ig-like domain-containing protein n=1 Tax=Fundulus heteroclitus TaxID=8078 RepID=A0A3Q2NSI3_FUNHE